MPLISDINLLQKEEQRTLTVRLRTGVEDLPMHIRESYGKIAAYMGKNGVIPCDVPFVAYHNMDIDDLDVEIGFAVPAALPDKDDIKAGIIAAGKLVLAMYLGPYGEMKDAYEKIGKFLIDNKLEPTGTAYEYYYNGPQTPPEQLLTKIVFALK